MRAFELIVTGDVQGVGLRRAVQKKARQFGITAYVENLEDGSVKLLVQGENDREIGSFLSSIEFKKDEIIHIEKMEKKEVPVSDQQTSFRIKYGTLVSEIEEGLGAGQTQFSMLRKDFGDYRSEFKDYRKEFDGFHSEFNDYRKEFKDFSGETSGNFKTLSDKYGEISSKLTQVLEALQQESAETRKEMTRAVDNLSQLINQYIDQSRKKQDKRYDIESSHHGKELPMCYGIIPG